jgi:carbonic anhydrase
MSDVSPGDLPAPPARALVVVTCMDARIDPLPAFGLRLGDAHVIRNAGAEVSDDVLRSATISRDALGTREAWVVGHSLCAAHGNDEERACEVARVGAENLRALGFDANARFYDMSSGEVRDL